VQEVLGGIRDVSLTTPSLLSLPLGELDSICSAANAYERARSRSSRFAIEAAAWWSSAALPISDHSTNNAGQVLPMLGTFVLCTALLPSMQLVYGNWALVVSNLTTTEVC